MRTYRAIGLMSGTAMDGIDVALIERTDIARLLPSRPLDSHKGKNGRALLCVGSERYTGAALLSVEIAIDKAWSAVSFGMPTDGLGEFVRGDRPLTQGSEVAFMPPMSGG